jgi:hypothetical protein
VAKWGFHVDGKKDFTGKTRRPLESEKRNQRSARRNTKRVEKARIDVNGKNSDLRQALEGTEP